MRTTGRASPPEFIRNNRVFHPATAHGQPVPTTIQFSLPDGRTVELPRNDAAELLDRLWSSDDLRGAVSLAAAIAIQLESTARVLRPIALDEREAAVFQRLAPPSA